MMDAPSLCRHCTVMAQSLHRRGYTEPLRLAPVGFFFKKRAGLRVFSMDSNGALTPIHGRAPDPFRLGIWRGMADPFRLGIWRGMADPFRLGIWRGMAEVNCRGGVLRRFVQHTTTYVSSSTMLSMMPFGSVNSPRCSPQTRSDKKKRSALGRVPRRRRQQQRLVPGMLCRRQVSVLGHRD